MSGEVVDWKSARAAALWLLLAAAMAVPASAQRPTDRAGARPNVVVILTDDQGWGDLRLHGNTNLRTPNLDAIARSGAAFEHFYVQPVCSPTRAEFLTGRYHLRSGVHGTSAGAERLDLDETTIAEVFRAAGYATGAFGKWHNGSQYPYHPNGRGFDEFYGFASGHWGHYFDWPLEQNGTLVRGRGFIPDDLTDRAMDFVERHRERPFFLYLPFNTPHSPMQVPERFYAEFATRDLPMRHADPAQEDLAHTRAALAMVENLDWNVGRLLRRLEQLGLGEETIIVFFNDNGPNGGRWNGGMRGRKGSTDEGGVRSPLHIRWPARIQPGTRISQIAGAIDLFPTLAGLAGVNIPGGLAIDGVSLEPLVTGTGTGAAGWPDRVLIAHWNGRVSVRDPRFRLDHEGRLYDIARDPGQQEDISGRYPDVARRLRQAAAPWISVATRAEAADPRPFPAGYRAFPVTWLPARDGVAHGAIQRSNRFPNASFFTDWKSLSDRITWDVEVATPGRYQAEVYYTARPEDVGAVVELSLGEARTRAMVREAFDPPLVGAAEDRVPRQESYVKEFRPMSLGELALPAGRGELVLRATEIPGERVMDVRAVRLRLLD